MNLRLKGSQIRSIFPKLPRNLIIFDGKCLLSQARAKYVIERNFNYFGYLSFVRSVDVTETEMFERIDRHKMYFMSVHSQDTRSVLRAIQSSRACVSDKGVKDQLDNATLIFIEKMYSRESMLLRNKGVNDPKEDLFLQLSNKKQKGPLKETGDQSVRTSFLSNPDQVDVMVSTDFYAMCRIGMHLDRWIPSLVFAALYYTTPPRLGAWWFNRYVNQRRKHIWGTSEKDAATPTAKIIEGMKERLWTLPH